MVRSELTFDGSRVANRAIGPGSLVASRFRLEDLLEEHSGARFWRATDLTLARNVAVHVISRDDPRARAVLTAARTSATVSDQRILRVLDAVEEDDLVHVVHEWGAGRSLDQLLVEETLEPRRAAWVVREVAEAIAVAHRHGIAHGHLLPENVLLTDSGSVKLIGFVVDAVLHGRPQPEGATGDPPSEHESDVLNLGALLYACVTGKWAGFPDSDLPRAPYDHGRVCRPRQVRAGVPKQLDALCDQILNPSLRGGKRFESAAEVCSALGEYLGDSLGTAVDLTETTAFLDPAGLQGPGTKGSLGTFDGTPPDPPDQERRAADSMQDTQPGMPFLDDPGSRSPRSPDDTDDTDDPHNTDKTGGTGGTDSTDGAAAVVPPPPHGTAGLDRPGARRAGSRPLLVALVVGAVAVAALVVLLGRELGGDSGGGGGAKGSSSDSSGGAKSQVIEPAAVSDFDPDGGPDPEENPDLVPLAVDGKPDDGLGDQDLLRRPRARALPLRCRAPPRPGRGDRGRPGVGAAPGRPVRRRADGRTRGGGPAQHDRWADQCGGPRRSLGEPDPARQRSGLDALPGGVAHRAAALRERVPGGHCRGGSALMTSAEPLDDRELLAAHVAGDPEAFGTLFARHRDRLWAVALRTTGDREEAADALQDALVSAFRRADTFRGDSAVTTWLHRIVVNAALDRLRRRKARPAEPLPEDLEERIRPQLAAGEASDGEDPERAALRAEQRREVMAALGSLRPSQRLALVLVDMEGHSVEEAAEILGVPTGTVKSRCSRGRARLLPLLSGNQQADTDVPPSDEPAGRGGGQA